MDEADRRTSGDANRPRTLPAPTSRLAGLGVVVGVGFVALAGLLLIATLWPGPDGGDSSATSSEATVPPLPSGFRGASEPRQTESLTLQAKELEIVDRLLREFPTSPDAFYARAFVLKSYGDTAEAVRCWEECLRVAPNFAPASQQIGLDAMNRGDYETAASRLRRAWELAPEAPEIGVDLAKALSNLRRTEEAIVVLDKHAAAHPGSTETWFRLGQAHFQREAFDRAKACYERAVRLDSNCTLAWFGLANTCERLGATEQAKQHRQKFLDLKKKELALERNQRRQYDDGLALRRRGAEVYATVAKACLACGKPAEAETCWRKAMESDPNDVASRLTLAMVLTRQNRAAEAIPLLEELRRIEPANPAHCVSLGTLRKRLRQFDAAEDVFKAAISLAPQQAEGHIGLAQTYIEARRNPEDARRLAEKAVRLQPTGENYFVLSAACLAARDRTAARAAVDEALRRDPRNPKYQEASKYLSEKE